MNYDYHNFDQSIIFLLRHIYPTLSDNTIDVFSVPFLKYPKTSNLQTESTVIWTMQVMHMFERHFDFWSFIWASDSKIPRNALLHFYGWWWACRNPSIFKARVTAKSIPPKNLSENKWEFRRDWYVLYIKEWLANILQ